MNLGGVIVHNMRQAIAGAAATLALVVLASCGQDAGNNDTATGFPDGEWIDLTYDFSEETVYWPTANSFVIDTAYVGMNPKGFYYSAYNFCAAEHGGTHMDAPVHFAEGRRSVDQVPVSQLIGPAVKIDVSEKCAADRDYLVTNADIEAWEATHGRIADHTIVLLQTGFGQYYPDPVRYLGTDERGSDAVAKLHFPGLDPDAAAWLVAERRVAAVGLDTASIDRGQATLFGAHVNLMTHNVPAFENVAHLDRVPATGAHIIALPMKIRGGSGGPARIVAFIPSVGQ